MSDLRNLYQEVILEHNRKPRNFGVLANATCQAHGDNPLCGDNYTVYARVSDDGVIEEVSFDGSGCAISKAAASMMTVRVKGKTIAEANTLIQEFRELMTGKLTAADDHQLGSLKVFEGVAKLPQRVKCAVLPWHALHAAIENKETVSTEGEHDPLGS